MLRPIDYVQTHNRSIHIVNYVLKDTIYATEIYRLVKDPSKHLYATPIKYKPDTNEYYEKYIRRDKDNIRIINIKDVRCRYYAKSAYKSYKSKLTGIWKTLDDYIVSLGITNLGIYGSVLLGFDIHNDIDFVVYGEQNRNILKDNISKLHKTCGIRPIDKKTINSRIATAQKFYNVNNSFNKIFPRQWSTLEVQGDVHSTIHFVKDDNRIFRPNLYNLSNMRLKGVVTKTEGFDFWPKTCLLTTDDAQCYTIFSTLWPYQSALRENEQVTIYGAVDKNNNVIYLNKKNTHFIKL